MRFTSPNSSAITYPYGFPAQRSHIYSQYKVKIVGNSSPLHLLPRTDYPPSKPYFPLPSWPLQQVHWLSPCPRGLPHPRPLRPLLHHLHPALLPHPLHPRLLRVLPHHLPLQEQLFWLWLARFCASSSPAELRSKRQFT